MTRITSLPHATNGTHVPRRTFLGLAAAAAMHSAHAGLSDLVARVTGTEDPGCLSVVLVDVTASISSADWALYERGFSGLIETNRVGDRIVLGAIGDRPVSKFIARADRAISLKHKRLEDEANLKRANAQLMDDFAQVRSSSATPAKATFILDAISATEQLFAQGRSQKQTLNLLLLSDMVEESPAANFARSPVDAAYAKKLIETRRTQGLLPDLRGVRVYVVGAGGRNGEQMARVQMFWATYFSATGASLQAYGRNPGPVSR